jgi:hypothetical protein
MAPTVGKRSPIRCHIAHYGTLGGRMFTTAVVVDHRRDQSTLLASRSWKYHGAVSEAIETRYVAFARRWDARVEVDRRPDRA